MKHFNWGYPRFFPQIISSQVVLRVLCFSSQVKTGKKKSSSWNLSKDNKITSCPALTASTSPHNLPLELASCSRVSDRFKFWACRSSSCCVRFSCTSLSLIRWDTWVTAIHNTTRMKLFYLIFKWTISRKTAYILNSVIKKVAYYSPWNCFTLQKSRRIKPHGFELTRHGLWSNTGKLRKKDQVIAQGHTARNNFELPSPLKLNLPCSVYSEHFYIINIKTSC